FAGAGGAQEEHVAFLQLQLTPARIRLNPFGVIIHGHRENLFGLGLTNDVVIERVLQCLGRPQARARRPRFGDPLLEQNLVTQVDTFIADVNRRSGNEPLDFLRRFATKRALQHVPLCVFPRHGCSLSLVPALWVKRPGSCRTAPRPPWPDGAPPAGAATTPYPHRSSRRVAPRLASDSSRARSLQQLAVWVGPYGV